MDGQQKLVYGLIYYFFCPPSGLAIMSLHSYTSGSHDNLVFNLMPSVCGSQFCPQYPAGGVTVMACICGRLICSDPIKRNGPAAGLLSSRWGVRLINGLSEVEMIWITVAAIFQHWQYWLLMRTDGTAAHISLSTELPYNTSFYIYYLVF